MIYSISRFIFFVLSKLFFGVTAVGVENIPKKGGFILASNHVSYLDPALVGIFCSKRLSFMARESLFENPILGWWCSAVGVIPLKRNAADLSALKEAMRRLKNGEGIVLFPEGTRQPAGASFGRPLAGVGFLAEKLRSPVVPVYVQGAENAAPKGTKLFRITKISVYYGKPFYIEEGMEYQQAADLIMNEIKQLAALHQQMKSNKIPNEGGF